MNELLLAAILGMVQGLTEFLPVSSSGHLELAKYLLGDESLPEQSLLMTVVVHFGTALSTVVIFWKDVQKILKSLFSFRLDEETMFAVKIIISMIPAALVGVFFEEEIDALFSMQLTLVGICLIVTAVLLLLADRAKDTTKKVGYGHSLIVGLSQAIAILPGISRSGATISTSVLLGIDRTRAARFSFLMVVPLIFGKIAKDLLSGDLAAASENHVGALIIGFLASFITGMIACKWMIALVKKSQLKYFAIYCVIVGIIAIILHLRM
ncbi:MAG: undecaprenyl-diphosphate phosphatase [Saprospiraceae bacterium]